MISIEEAKRWVFDKCFLLDEEYISIEQSVNRVLAQNLEATLDLPSFRNSAMDGYAVLREDLEEGLRELKVMGEIQAGRSEKLYLEKGQAFRIFTGAVVPENSDLIIIQEKTDKGEEIVKITSYSSENGSHIRKIGEQIKKGDVALEAGHLINPASVGLMASFGISDVLVHRLPKIGIITTGNELKKPGETLDMGEIYESNSFSLKAALNQSGFSSHIEMTVVDDFDRTVKDIGSVLEECDVLVLSGGISVGKYDFVKKALEENDVEEVFHKIYQKPGKPMYFGVKEEKLIFALPGNPASLLVCYYEYVLPALKKISGKDYAEITMFKKLRNDISFGGDRPEFVRAHYVDDEVEVLTGQSSFMLKSFAEANCLVYLHGMKKTLEKGSEVVVHPIY